MFVRIVVILAIIAATAVYSFWSKKSLETQLIPATQSAAVLAKLPSASFETLEGQPFHLEEQSFDLLVVHYWGTWCAPCEAELPDLLRFIDRFKTQSGVKFLLVAVNDEVLKIKKHLKSVPIPKDAQITWLLDNQNIHKDVFGTTRVPETFVFSSDKTTLRKYVGPQDWNKPMFFQTFDEFLQISTRKL